MNDEAESLSSQRSWLERLSDALLREPQDREQLLILLRDAKDRGLLDSDSLVMMEGVLQFSVMRVRDVMVPRAQMVVIEQDASFETILPIVIESAHSRFPVIGESRDEVVGILLAKDLLGHIAEEKEFNVTNLLRPAVFVPESKRLDVLLREFRVAHNHMALVVDEYGSMAGLVTIEDVLEQIVGEIEDEHDTADEPNIKKHTENKYIVKALTPIDEFNTYFNDELSDEEFDTVGGLVMGAFGYLPKRAETIKIGKYQFKVLHADNRRIRILQVKVL